MSIYGGFETKKQELTYGAYLERMMFLLAKRIVWSIHGNKFDEEKWINTFKKLYKNLHIMDNSKEEKPRYSRTVKVLADALEVIPSDDWVIESLSRRSSASRSRPRKQSEDIGGRKALFLMNRTREDDLSFHPQETPQEQKRRWPVLRPAFENKAGWGKNIMTHQAYSTKNDDKNILNGTNPNHYTNYQDDSIIENNKVCNTDFNLPRGRSLRNKHIDLLALKLRSGTPKMYYRGSFDVNLESPSKRKKSKRIKTPASRNSVTEKIQKLIKYNVKKKAVNQNDTNELDQDLALNTTHFNNFHNNLETPINETFEQFKVKPPKNRLRELQPSPLKAFTGTFYNNPTVMNPRKSSEERKGRKGMAKYSFDLNLAGKIKSHLKSPTIHSTQNFLVDDHYENH